MSKEKSSAKSTSSAEFGPAILDTAPSHVSEVRRIIKLFFRRKISVIGLVMITLLIVIAIFCPILSPYDPYKIDVVNKLAQPSIHHLLGTDSVGRDILSRVLWGARTSLIIGICASAISATIGITLGLIAAFYGGWVHTIIMRFVDAWMAIPSLFLIMLISGLIGGGMSNIIICLGIGMMTIYCRVTCGQALSIRQNDYILAEQSIGASNLRVMFLHVLPNCFAPLIIIATVQMGGVILSESSLSFLGFGIKPPTPAWGGMVSDGYKYLLTNPILSVAPGAAIMMVVFGFNMMGDGLRDVLDPRLRGVL